MATLKRGAPVPDIIWSSMETVLHANMYRLAKDIAKALGKPEAPLLQALKEPIRPYIFEEAEAPEIDARCGFMCQKPETPLYSEPCGRAIMWGTKVCAEHAYKKATPPPAIKLQALDMEEEALAVSEDGTVYNADYEAVGRYDRRTQSLIRFQEN